jgi:hypothetical protein
VRGACPRRVGSTLGGQCPSSAARVWGAGSGEGSDGRLRVGRCGPGVS